MLIEENKREEEEKKKSDTESLDDEWLNIYAAEMQNRKLIDRK